MSNKQQQTKTTTISTINSTLKNNNNYYLEQIKGTGSAGQLIVVLRKMCEGEVGV